jgi:hypothetical protein
MIGTAGRITAKARLTRKPQTPCATRARPSATASRTSPPMAAGITSPAMAMRGSRGEFLRDGRLSGTATGDSLRHSGGPGSAMSPGVGFLTTSVPGSTLRHLAGSGCPGITTTGALRPCNGSQLANRLAGGLFHLSGLEHHRRLRHQHLRVGPSYSAKASWVRAALTASYPTTIWIVGFGFSLPRRRRTARWRRRPPPALRQTPRCAVRPSPWFRRHPLRPAGVRKSSSLRLRTGS